MTGYTPSPYVYLSAVDRISRQSDQARLVFAVVALVSLGAVAYCANALMDRDRGRSL
jgi:hypothetical protein